MKNKILIGITLFSMFFGAGNLIFPGAEAGTSGWLAFVGLSFSAVCFPILGVVAVTLSGGADRMAGRVHPMFSVVFISALYLAIGPCLAIPRTSGTSFSMAVQPFLPEGMPVGLVQFIYSIIFFTVAARIALHPERLTEYLGKRLTPILLTLIVIIFVVSLIHPTGSAAAPLRSQKCGRGNSFRSRSCPPSRRIDICSPYRSSIDRFPWAAHISALRM